MQDLDHVEDSLHEKVNQGVDEFFLEQEQVPTEVSQKVRNAHCFMKLGLTVYNIYKNSLKKNWCHKDSKERCFS